MASLFKQITLRLPVELHAALCDLAKREGRSLHGQAVYMLRRALESQP